MLIHDLPDGAQQRLLPIQSRLSKLGQHGRYDRGNAQRHFQYLGCSGALVGQIKDKQVPKMQQSQAVIVSAGGNDAHLSVILNYCVYQWSTQWFWTCDGELDSAENEVNSDSYFTGMKDLLTAIEAKLVDFNSRIYWPGYIKFFDDTSKDCDEVTWAFTRNLGFREYLTQARRYLKAFEKYLTNRTDAMKDSVQQFGQPGQ